MKNFEAFKEHGDVIWNIANLLRGPYRPPQYRRVMIPLAVFQVLACHRHQELQRHLRQDLALAHLLLDGFRQDLHQRQPPRYPAHATIEPARQLVEAIAEALLQLRQQPAHLQRGLVFAQPQERSSSTAAASLIGHTTASTVSRPSCSSAAIGL